MPPSRRFMLSAAVFALVLVLHSSRANAQQKASSPDEVAADKAKVVDTVKAIFAAAEADDLSLFRSLTAPGFYIFDDGARFDGDAIMALIRSLHAAGKRYQWNVTNPDVHIEGNFAWVAYMNQGSITDPAGRVNKEWLESAVLQKQGGSWKVVFMQSTPVSSKSPTKPSDPRH